MRVKICGVTRPDDAELALALGADFLGLNFWPRSSRHLDPGAAREVVAVARGRATLVGVFVNQPRHQVAETVTEVGLDLAQFHGDEEPQDLAPFGSQAIKALRFSGRLDPALLSPYAGVWGFLLEARHEAAFGGAGKEWNYAAARGLDDEMLAGRPLLLAGGLRPENVRRAIAASGAWGVDVASGVESSPGVKDAAKLERFFEEVTNATE